VDAVVTAQAVNPGANHDWFYGLGIRGRTVGSSIDFYYFKMSGFGSWEFGISKANTPTSIAGGGILDFKNDSAVNLRILAVGGHLEFYIDDVKVWTAEDIKLDAAKTNQIMLIGGTNVKTASQLVKFTDLKVVAPKGIVKNAPTAVVSAPAALPFAENFADNGNQWGLVARDEMGTIDITDGALRIDTLRPSQLQWTSPAVTFPADIDVTVTAQAIKPDKNNGWDYGLGLRGRDVDTSSGFYYLDVFGDGTWQFAVHPKTQTATVITGGQLSDFKPDATTKLRIVALGSHFELYINDVKVGTADDSALDAVEANQIILMGGTTDKTPSQLVKFTNLAVATAKASGNGGNVAPTAAASLPAVLPFAEDFSNASNPNGWKLETDEAGSIAVQDGALLIDTAQAKYIHWTYPSLAFQSNVDVTVMAQAMLPDGVSDWYYGIGVRGRGKDQSGKFYYFDVNGNGHWEFGVLMHGDWYQAMGGELGQFKPDAATTLRVTVTKNRFAFYVNDVKVGAILSGLLPEVADNQVILFGGNDSRTASQRVKFTNLSVVSANNQ
jgi:hypothetical protein